MIRRWFHPWVTCVGVLALSLGVVGESRSLDLLPGDLVVVEQGSSIVRMDATSGLTETIYQGGLLPRAGIVLDHNHHILFVATSNQAGMPLYSIVRVAPLGGNVTIVSADGLLDSSSFDIAVDHQGLIYVAAGVSGVLRIDPLSGVQEVFAAPPAIIPPFGIAIDDADRIWIAESQPGVSGIRLARLRHSDGLQEVVYTLNACTDSRNGRLLATDGSDVLVNCSAAATYPSGPDPSSVFRVDADTGATDIVTSGNLLDDLYGVSFEDTGDIVVAGSGQVVRVDPISGVQTLVGSAGATGIAVVRAACDDGFDNDGDGQVDFPSDLECTQALDLSERLNPCGDLLDNDSDGSIDFPADPGCTHFRTTTESPSCNDGIDNDLDGAIDMADPDCSSEAGRLERPLGPGDVLVVDEGVSGTLVRIDPVSGLQESLGELGYLDLPRGVALDRDRSVLIADAGAAAVVRIDSAGEQELVASGDLLEAPSDVAVEAFGDLVVADELAMKIVRVDATTGAQASVSDFETPPISIDLDIAGDLWVAEPGLDRLLRVDPTDGSQFVELSIVDPMSVALGPTDEVLIATDFPGSLISYDPVTILDTEIAMGLGTLSGVAATPAGDAFVTDLESASLLRIPLAGGATEVVSQDGLLSAPTGVTVVLPSCGDLLDNDGDGLVDFPDDPGCAGSSDDSERSPALICDNGIDDDADLLIDFPADPGCDDPLDPSERSPSLICDDGLDNDVDFVADYPADPGCDDPLDADEISPDLPCDDGTDNDDDTFFDFPADPGCDGPAGPLENPHCDDGEDNDGDGLTDLLQDPGCIDPFDTSENEPTLICDDGLDNDGDGKSDHPSDTGCTDVLDDSELESTIACDDGVDNDGDGFIDFPDDQGCSSSADMTEIDSSLQCDDGVDNDGDGFIDFPDDQGCSSSADMTEVDPSLQCDDGVDNDGDGMIDFPRDPACSNSTWPVEASACDDGADNDGDGNVDFPADTGCASATDLSETDGSPACSNGVDDDGDGFADHPADPGCSDALDLSERGSSLICDNGIDDDADGVRDYPGDPGCAGVADGGERGVAGFSPACDDGVDNDGDGSIDFPLDPGCTGPHDASETASFLACDDGVDNDGDGQVDHPGDSDCADSLDPTEGIEGETLAPTLIRVSVISGETGATASWVTDEPAQASVELDSGETFQNLDWNTQHTVSLEGLDCDTTHTLSASSTDAWGNVATAHYEVTFDTLDCGSGHGLLAHWNFEEGTGSTTSDASGGGYGGALLNPTWVPGTGDGSEFALDFNGVSDRVDVGSIDIASNELTLVAWAKPTAWTEPARDGRFISKATSIREKDHFWMLGTMAVETETRLRLRVSTDEQTSTLVASSENLELDEWVHAAGVYDGSKMHLYQNGIEVGSLLKDDLLDGDASVMTSIGNQPLDAGDKPFAGMLDEIRIYDRALTGAEIAGLFGSQATAIGNVSPEVGLDSAQIRWQTDQAATTELVYIGPKGHSHDVSSSFYSKDHGVSLSGLAPESVYLFEIRSTNEGGVTSTYSGSFTTATQPELPGLSGFGCGLLIAAMGLLGGRRARRLAPPAAAARLHIRDVRNAGAQEAHSV